MSQLVIFKRKQRQGPAPALSPGKSYQIIEQKERHGKDMVLVSNDRGVNKWYHRDDFEEDKPVSPEQVESIQLLAALERIKTLESYLDRIANGAQPNNDSQAWSWIVTARLLANEALSPNQVKEKEDEQ